jgi:NaMN:DMB phosphoribosyltransferase
MLCVSGQSVSVVAGLMLCVSGQSVSVVAGLMLSKTVIALIRHLKTVPVNTKSKKVKINVCDETMDS